MSTRTDDSIFLTQRSRHRDSQEVNNDLDLDDVNANHNEEHVDGKKPHYLNIHN